MKALNHALLIAGLIVISTQASAGQWPVRGSELEKACISYGEVAMRKAFRTPAPGEQPISTVAETDGVLKTALSYTDEDLKKVHANLDEVIAIDPAKKDSLENIAYFICTTELKPDEVQMMRNALLDPKSVTPPGGSK